MTEEESDYKPSDFYGVSYDDREKLKADFESWAKYLRSEYGLDANKIRRILHEIVLVTV